VCGRKLALLLAVSADEQSAAIAGGVSGLDRSAPSTSLQRAAAAASASASDNKLERVIHQILAAVRRSLLPPRHIEMKLKCGIR